MATQFITDSKGKKIAVILPIEDYNKMIEDLEDIDDVRLYDEVKQLNEPSIPIEEAFKLIESKRKS
ncbi:MAG: hypothetical protein IPO45_11845 [Saprospiraceae bacterium]|jgi:hypothetical protein|uniref:hypothetical protein n=1 Tax=Candidatus Brachybacter algidus TaxID=2982024 RepID=UPI001B561B75|nr:hypothetical protein [Candidatus Brachybacter algidus]MBP7307262.1 hypothetical protein [Saprospiraceae bacterium]MBK6373836.1 hypothetical protein [Candidatus Brachybacter algidus]MBK6448999.1 hypothetical protein [Candidatus Brachybacter algidus]MBK8355596.1 hypothetical protein [Candidatus Brachybacter algidus]MBK8604243.1 hypothetical protein [Candidatus Brachybacter algidus]